MAQRVFSVIVISVAFATLTPAYAQQDGYDASTGVQGVCVSNCNIPADPSGGYSADQQAMLNVAGQLGFALGSAIRQSFIESRQRAAIAAQQRAYAAEQARQRAAEEEALQRQRNQTLLTNMHGTIGAGGLQSRQSGASGQLRMRTTNDMFSGSSTNALGEGSWAAYYNALQRRDAAVGLLDACEDDLDAARRIVAQAERNALDHPGAESARLLTEARAVRDRAQRARDAAEADLRRAETTLTAAADARSRALQVNTDASVVDLRGASSTPELLSVPAGVPPSLAQGLPRLPEVENSPGRDQWWRGMQAAANHNWEQATAAFEAARARDPDNEALRQAVVLAEWTRDFYRRDDARAAAALRVPRDEDLEFLFPGDDDALRVPRDDDLALLFDSRPTELPPATPEERRRLADARSANTIPPEDANLLMRDPSRDREQMVDSLAPGQRAYLATRGDALPLAHDWSDGLTPEVRGMLAEIRNALPPRTYGPPDLTPDGALRASQNGVNDAAGDQAIVLLLYGDLSGAQRALGEAAAADQSFSRAYNLVRGWARPAPALSGLAPVQR